jgi:hypothetical protein
VSKPRSLLRLLGVMVLAIAVGVTFAGPASAKMSKAQKRHAAKALVKQLKKNPRLIKNKRWLRKAGHVNATLPLTVRLNPVVALGTDASHHLVTGAAASNDTATIDLTSSFGPEVGPKQVTLDGSLRVLAKFGNPAEGDDLGDLSLSVTSASLTASSIGVLENPAVTCPAGPASTLTAGGRIARDGSGLAPLTGPTGLAPTVDANTVLRTAPISLSAANIAGSPNIGKANIFKQSNNVRLSLHTTAAVTTIFRSTENGTGDTNGSTNSPFAAGLLPTALFNCDESFGGSTSSAGLGSAPGNGTTLGDVGPVGSRNVIPVDVAGSLQINPALTTDGALRLATLDVHSSQDREATVDACLQVASLVKTATADAHVGVLEGNLGVPAGTLAGISTTGPTGTPCADTDPSHWPLVAGGLAQLVNNATPTDRILQLDPTVSVDELSGEALVGDV